MNDIQKFKIILNEAMQIDGDIIDFRVAEGNTFAHLITTAAMFKRMAYGFDTFTGLHPPTKEDFGDNFCYSNNKGMYKISLDAVINNLKDLNKYENNYKIKKATIFEVRDLLPTSIKFNFAILDLFQYVPAKEALQLLKDTMNYGGIIYVQNYDDSVNNSSHLAIKEFLKLNDNDIIYNTQLIINGIKQNHLIIKYFNPKYETLQAKKYTVSKKPLTVAMVLKTGGVYDYRYVNALANGLKKHSTIDYKLVCLTDDPKGITSKIDEIIPFKHNYPKWWGKIELFRDDLFGNSQVFFLDLDTIIVKNIDNILSFNTDFSGLRDFYHLDSLGSGLMAWNPEKTKQIYNKFVPQADNIMTNYLYGDQQWINEQKPSIEYLQDAFGNGIVSYKKNCVKHDKIVIPEKAQIICFHGNPRPHTITDPIIREHWNFE